jgi:beta-glucosidase
MTKWKLLTVSVIVGGLGAAHGGNPSSSEADARARNLVAQMTLEEKISQAHGLENKTYYRYVPPVERLKIPALHVANGPCGVGPAGDRPQKPATALPAPISVAASWDLPLARRYAEIIAEECLNLNEDLLEAPDINIARVPQNGRTFEAFGEDPFLVARLAVNQVQGIQAKGVIANVKHYAANNQEVNRLSVNVVVDERTLREIYLPAFEASIREGRSASIMGAYPQVNGHFCCENEELLTRILRKEWGFDGFVTSDFGAVHSTVPSALAGLDLEMPNDKYFGAPLLAAVRSNQVPVAVVDEMLVRRYRKMIEFGMFDRSPNPGPIAKEAHGAEARHTAEQGMVLLKNKHDTLPLDASKLRRIALIGPYATNAMTGGGGSSHVIPLYTVTPLEGLQRRAGNGCKVELLDGKDIAQAVALARSSDVAIVMVGDKEEEAKDHGLSFAGNQDKLVEAVAAANKHTVVVLKSGTAMLMPWVDKVPAILEAWYPGEEEGNAVASVLFGDVNPSGKLPLTFPRQVSDLPANTRERYPGEKGAVCYTEGVFVGYRHFDARKIKPLFPFGHGLSYTTFGYRNLTVTPSRIGLGETLIPTVAVEFDLRNTGKKAGAEVAQVYLGLPSSPEAPQPPKQLKGFEKVMLEPGESRRVRIELNARAFSYWDTQAHGWRILPGRYRVFAGSSSRDLRLDASIQIAR